MSDYSIETTSPPVSVPTPSRAAISRATRGTMALFFANGATFATWGVHIPTIKAQIGRAHV